MSEYNKQALKDELVAALQALGLDFDRKSDARKYITYMSGRAVRLRLYSDADCVSVHINDERWGSRSGYVHVSNASDKAKVVKSVKRRIELNKDIADKEAAQLAQYNREAHALMAEVVARGVPADRLHVDEERGDLFYTLSDGHTLRLSGLIVKLEYRTLEVPVEVYIDLVEKYGVREEM